MVTKELLIRVNNELENYHGRITIAINHLNLEEYGRILNERKDYFDNHMKEQKDYDLLLGYIEKEKYMLENNMREIETYLIKQNKTRKVAKKFDKY